LLGMAVHITFSIIIHLPSLHKQTKSDASYYLLSPGLRWSPGEIQGPYILNLAAASDRSSPFRRI
jgi:hypothetical protein